RRVRRRRVSPSRIRMRRCRPRDSATAAGRRAMGPVTRRLVASIAAVCITAAIGAGFGTAAVSADNVRWGAGYFPNVTLTTHEGRPVRFYDDLIKGKI